MLKINRLREFCAEAQEVIKDIRSAKVVITKDEVARFMREHSDEDNYLLLAIVPEHDLAGSEDANRWQNDLGFYILKKTDYSEHDHDSYIDIFSDVQLVTEELVDLILNHSDENQSVFCDLFGSKDKVVINVSPVKGLASCNGYFIGLRFDSQL